MDNQAPGPDMVHLRITAAGKHLLAEGYMRQGMTFWAARANAEIYINTLHIAEPIGGPAAPSEHKPAGPGETKPAAPAEKKSSTAGRGGRSTASQASNVAGLVQSSFLSQAAPASQSTTSEPSSAGAPPDGNGESSQ